MMESSRFDLLARRLTTTGSRRGAVKMLAIAGLGLGLPRVQDGAATKRKKRCRKLTQACQPGSKKKRCCKKQDLVCSVILGLDGNHCCRPSQGNCAVAGDCCGGRTCANVAGLDGPRCCVIDGGACVEDQDCCAPFSCNEQTGFCE